jgi:hypothetical protein
MEELHYKSNVTYIPYQKRYSDYTNNTLPFVILVLVVIFIISPEAAFFISLGMLFNYYVFATNVRFYLKEIIIDKDVNTCYIQYYDKNKLKKGLILLEDLEIKLEKIYDRYIEYKLCIYDDRELITFQLCGIGYWSKEICEEIIKAYAQIRKENLKQEKNIK